MREAILYAKNIVFYDEHYNWIIFIIIAFINSNMPLGSISFLQDHDDSRVLPWVLLVGVATCFADWLCHSQSCSQWENDFHASAPPLWKNHPMSGALRFLNPPRSHALIFVVAEAVNKAQWGARGLRGQKQKDFSFNFILETDMAKGKLVNVLLFQLLWHIVRATVVNV